VRRRTVIAIAGVGAVALAAGLAIVLADRGDSARHSPGPPLGFPTVAVRLPPGPNGEMPPDPNAGAAQAYSPPTLGPGDAARAAKLLANDEYMSGLLDGTPYTIEHSWPWWSSGRKRLEGAALDLVLAEPVSVAETYLPILDYSCDGKSYKQRYLHARIEGATIFSVSVDFDKQRVVWLRLPEGGASELPGNRHKGVPCGGPGGR
jgi:hypothetical protein